jgi:hypothetical protein
LIDHHDMSVVGSAVALGSFDRLGAGVFHDAPPPSRGNALGGDAVFGTAHESPLPFVSV